jgi:hypothetical protein
MVKPITDATQAATRSIQSDISKMLESALVNDGSRHAYTFWQMFRDVGKSILGQITGMISEAVMKSLNIEPTLNALFGKVAGGLDLVKPEDVQQQLARITQTNTDITRVNTEAIASLTQAIRGGGASGGATGPFTNIPGVPTASGGPFGTAGQVGGMIPGPVGGVIRTGLSVWNTVASLFGGGGSGSVILRGEGGIVHGPLLPLMAFAGGGVVDRPTFALIGERGEREAIIPESKWGLAGGGGGGNAVHNWYIQAADPASFIDMLEKHGDAIVSVVSGRMNVNHPSLRQWRQR